MAFPPEVKQAALVAAARHCCVCHRYKGVKVEVHHIVQEGDGGSNDFDNAIVLCFDCHADAGHYNPRHPRGSKLSLVELRVARDRWFEIVRKGITAPSTEPDLFYYRYLVCRDLDILKEIVNKDLTRIPVKDPVLVENASLDFLSVLVREEEEASGQGYFFGDTFPDRDAYLRNHPEAVAPDRSDGPHSFFEFVRTPSREELIKQWSPGRPLLRRLLEVGAQPQDISVIGSYFEGCGIPVYQEVIITMPLWTAFLVAENVHNSALTIKAMNFAPDPGPPYRFRPFRPSNADANEINMPSAPLRPGMTTIIPLGVLLGPLHKVERCWSETTSYIKAGLVQSLSHCTVSSEDSLAYGLWGPFLWPLGFRVVDTGLNRYQQVHELDLANMYTLDRHWQMGSCPHLFFVSSISGRISYFGPLFAAGQGKTMIESFIVPYGFDTALIAELEEETTHLYAAWIGSNYYPLSVSLRPGQIFTFQVEAGSSIHVQGHYEPVFPDLATVPNAVRRSKLVDEFIREWSQHPFMA